MVEALYSKQIQLDMESAETILRTAHFLGLDCVTAAAEAYVAKHFIPIAPVQASPTLPPAQYRHGIVLPCLVITQAWQMSCNACNLTSLLCRCSAVQCSEGTHSRCRRSGCIVIAPALTVLPAQLTQLRLPFLEAEAADAYIRQTPCRAAS